MPERICLGETSGAGLPISAPVYDNSNPAHVASTLRWVKRKDDTFTLCVNIGVPYGKLGRLKHEWVEIPVVA